ncbi:MAG: hypothetical protein U1E36_01045 [Rickettsiales bacterium]
MRRHYNIYEKTQNTDALDSAVSDSDIDVDSLVNNGAGTYSLTSAGATNEVETIRRETGTNIRMGTENDMEELLGGNDRDPGAGRTLHDSEWDEIEQSEE